MDNIISGSPLNPRVLEVVPTDDYKLILTFANGEQRVFDAKPLLAYPAFEPLASRAFSMSVKVAWGTATWPQDIDCCPDTLYMDSVPVGAVA